MEYIITIGDIDLIVESQRRNICEDLVEQLKEHRLSRGMSQQDVANITGIKRPNIARLEACTTTPTIDILIKYATAIGYKLSFSLEEDEVQRMGRNKLTTIDKTYISSGEYRRKFDLISSSDELNRLVYQKTKEMLFHRSGTEFEDMCWIDVNTCEVICEKLDETNVREIRHTKAIDKKLKEHDAILAIHTHPHSMPPSAEDFNSFVRSGYKEGIVICHNGSIYRYSASREISEQLLMMYINRYYLQVKDECQAELMALDIMSKSGDIFYEEVTL